jgi:hypothetical protein
MEPDWNYLGEAWLNKWRRSDAKAPFGIQSSPGDGTGDWEAAILAHPQFKD